MTTYPSIEQFHRAATQNERTADLAHQEYLVCLAEQRNGLSAELQRDNGTYIDTCTAISLQKAAFKGYE
jgi:hypothetical protein